MNKPVVLITGGYGFIGSHLARRLFKTDQYIVRIVDINRTSFLDQPFCHNFICGSLCDENLCARAVEDVDTIFHFAANMGGMGIIHETNDFLLYQENHLMTVNLIRAATTSGVRRFVYASSACVYPEGLQKDFHGDVSLAENDVWENPPPKPQGLYGTEKLVSEVLLLQFASKMDIRIARFHNVYGPGGAWNDGREKAPAAMLRKAIAISLLVEKGSMDKTEFEIWGGGQQRRSFLYIEDAIEAILKLIESPETKLCNVGSDHAVTIQRLAELALEVANIDRSLVRFSYDSSKPVGVAARNSNNQHVQRTLGWQPKVKLEEGMKKTGEWIREQIRSKPRDQNDREILWAMLQSQVLNLQIKPVVFAILLPITSRGSEDPEDCLRYLRGFAETLFQTTRSDCQNKIGGGTQFRVVVYLAIDEDDDFLREDGLEPSIASNRAEDVLHDSKIFDVVTILCNHPRGHVCKIWRQCAKKAYEDECDFMVLMGDDVELLDEGWMQAAYTKFEEMAAASGTNLGFGCVAFHDVSFPGMPTFPIVHRTHLEIFEGEVVPDIFINQDGDPFIFQLYRRFACSNMFSSRISNRIGGETSARYDKRHAEDWTFETLDEATASVESWIKKKGYKVNKLVTLDVIVPCYRVDLAILDRILELKSSNTCSLMFIIIVDNPHSPNIFQLKTCYGPRPDVRIRVQKRNSGASGARNKGLQESSAEWVHFLDDDVLPRQDIFFRVEESIRKYPKAAGFVGVSHFPCADSIFTAAIHISGVTYFWDIAEKISNDDDVPWGVTANLVARRNVRDGVKFSLIYPKTGGGEDIDFVRRKRDYSVANGGDGFFAAPDAMVVHPWWNNGKRSYWRFHNWAFGDGALIKEFPEHTHFDFAPNGAECLSLCGILAVVSAIVLRRDLFIFALKAMIAVVIAHISHDLYRHLVQHPERTEDVNTNVRGFRWLAAVVESTFIRIFSELGRLRGILHRGQYGSIGRRFDWFTGRYGEAPIREERMNSVQRAVLSVVFSFVLMKY